MITSQFKRSTDPRKTKTEENLAAAQQFITTGHQYLANQIDTDKSNEKDAANCYEAAIRIAIEYIQNMDPSLRKSRVEIWAENIRQEAEESLNKICPLRKAKGVRLVLKQAPDVVRHTNVAAFQNGRIYMFSENAVAFKEALLLFPEGSRKADCEQTSSGFEIYANTARLQELINISHQLDNPQFTGDLQGILRTINAQDLLEKLLNSFGSSSDSNHLKFKSHS